MAHLMASLGINGDILNINISTQDYYLQFGAAYVRGMLADSFSPEMAELFHYPLIELSAAEMQELIEYGKQRTLRMHRFKRTRQLPRFKHVLGVLKHISPASLLDIGSGRGTFLWPLLDEFSGLPVTAIDASENRVRDLQAVSLGGFRTVQAFRMDACSLGFSDRTFDAVCMLEVLEHIPDAEHALAEAVRVARHFVVLSVPSKADNNPEHVHLFSRDRMEGLLLAAGSASVNISYVLNHLIAVARI